MNTICGIYKIISPSKKIYIGQSVDIKKRFKQYYNLHCNTQTKIYNSLKKYGPEKHKFEIIHVCQPEQLNELEIYYIELFQCFNSKYGLNLKSGGDSNFKQSDESNLKNSISNTGKVFSEIHKKRMSESGGNRKGIKHTEETKLKMRLASKKVRKPLSEEHKKKISEAHKGKMAWNKGLKTSTTIIKLNK